MSLKQDDLDEEMYLALSLKDNDYNTFKKKIEELSSQGYILAKYELGLIHYDLNKKNTEENKISDWDELKIFNWFEKLANDNLAQSQYILSTFYLDSFGCKKNTDMAMNWLRKSAHRGYVKAQKELAKYYLDGMYVEVNYKKAFIWYSKAAEQDDSESFYQLAKMNESGVGIKVNKTTALKLYEKAAKNGNAMANYVLALKYLTGNENEVQKSEEKAYFFMQTAAQLGNLDAFFKTACFNLDGIGVKKDYKKGINLLIACANEKYEPAISMLKQQKIKGFY